MDSFTSLVETLRSAWHMLKVVPFGTNFASAALMALAICLFVSVGERLSGTPRTNYRTRAFATDIGYWFYYRTGIHTLLLFLPVAAVLEWPLSQLATGLCSRLPYAAQVAIIFVGSDFAAYWIHRAEHHFKFLWAFHTTHHSQTELNFATIARFHPVEMLYHNIIVYIPLRILGLDPTAWLPLFLLNHLHGGWVHTRLPWKLGPLYTIIATPVFHSYHHSTDPAHHDKNFSSVFSLWDYLFGTAVRNAAKTPAEFGLAAVSPSVTSTLFSPFRLLYEFYLEPASRLLDRDKAHAASGKSREAAHHSSQ